MRDSEALTELVAELEALRAAHPRATSEEIFVLAGFEVWEGRAEDDPELN